MGYASRTQGLETVLGKLGRFGLSRIDLAPSVEETHPLHRGCHRLEEMLYQATATLLKHSGLDSSTAPYPTPQIQLADVCVKPDPKGDFSLQLRTLQTGHRRLALILSMKIHPEYLVDSTSIEKIIPAAAAHEIGHALLPAESLENAAVNNWKNLKIPLPNGREIYIPEFKLADPSILGITTTSGQDEVLDAERALFNMLEELTADTIGLNLLPPGTERNELMRSFDKLSLFFLQETAKRFRPLAPLVKLEIQVVNIGAVSLFSTGQETEIPAVLYPPKERKRIDALVNFYVGQMRGIENRAASVHP